MKNTSESWLETMDTKKGYFINHVDEAQSFIEKITNEKTAQIPYPMDSSDKSYYITISGKVFFAKTISGKGFVIQKEHVRRPSSEKFVKLSTGKHREIQVTVAQCLYNSFVIGKWLDVRPCYKNGNKLDYSLDNLVLPFEASQVISSSKMGMYAGLYKSHFERVRLYLSRTFNLSKEDAEDIVQDAFIHVTCNRDCEDVLVTWVWYCKQRVKDFIQKRCSLSCFDYDPYFFNKDFEFPLYDLLPVKRDREILEMRYKGYKNTEIAKILSISKGNVDARISRSLTLIKKILKKDLEYYEKRRRV